MSKPAEINEQELAYRVRVYGEGEHLRCNGRDGDAREEPRPHCARAAGHCHGHRKWCGQVQEACHCTRECVCDKHREGETTTMTTTNENVAPRHTQPHDLHIALSPMQIQPPLTNHAPAVLSRGAHTSRNVRVHRALDKGCSKRTEIQARAE